jgi:hypothetical protein
MKRVGILGGLGGMMGAALAAALASSGPAMTHEHRPARRSMAAPTRSTWKRSGGRRAGYPGQSPEQKAYALERAQAKRDRKAAALTRWAERSAEGAQAWRLALTGGATY